MEKSTIKFLTPVSLEEAKELIEYVARELPANVHYRVEYFVSINHGSADGEDPIIYGGTVGISASVSRVGTPMAFDIFEFGSSTEDPSMLDCIRFQMVPDWELSDYRPEIRQLWDDTRGIVQEYFIAREYTDDESEADDEFVDDEF